MPFSKSADNGGWGLGDIDIDTEVDGEREVEGEREALPPGGTYSTNSHKVDTCVDATSGVLIC